MSEDSVVLLGVKGGPSVLPGGSMPTSSLVRIGGRDIVLDCGLGVTRGLTAQGFRLQDLNTIIITHLHSDHYLELGPLIHTAWTCGLRHTVNVYGPNGLGDYWRNFVASMSFDVDLRQEDEGRPELATLVQLHPIASGPVFELDGIRVSALRNNHPPIEETYAVAFKTDAAKIVFSGDTAPFDGFTEFAAGADLLVHEAMLAAGVERIIERVGLGERLRKHLYSSHTLAEDAGRIAAEAGVKALALHHLVPCDDPVLTPDDWVRAARTHWDGPLQVGRDGLVVPVGN